MDVLKNDLVLEYILEAVNGVYSTTEDGLISYTPDDEFVGQS